MRVPEEHGPSSFLPTLMLGLTIWLVLIAGILFGISQLLNY